MVVLRQIFVHLAGIYHSLKAWSYRAKGLELRFDLKEVLLFIHIHVPEASPALGTLDQGLPRHGQDSFNSTRATI